MKKNHVLIGAGLLVLAALALGPKVSLVPSSHTIALDQDITRYLANQEARFSDITDGAEKKLRWHNANKPEKTTFAIVYLHGFSATRQETAPLSEQLADQLGANVYYARLRGHGRGSAAMSEATADDWLRDTREAYEIGKAIGDKVVLIGVSTGATLATWLGMQEDQDELAALILISPNFGLADPSAKVLTMPWGLPLAELLTGKTRSFEASNEQHDKYWTSTYALSAAAQMMALLGYVDALPLHEFDRPVLYIRSDSDRVIDMQKADEVFELFASDVKETLIVTHTDDPYGHVIAGDILSPSSTPKVRQSITNFIQALP
ncbi:MAG: alpha/beta fold hydrolase [Pseudomonadota bacterium]